MNNLTQEYNRMTTTALQAWQENPGVGEPQPLPDGYYKFGISIGSLFQPTPSLATLFSDIENIARRDTNLVTIPRSSYHFTFLALAAHTMEFQDPLPPEISLLVDICRANLEFTEWRLDDLRVIPGRNFMLLVGTPSSKLEECRGRFADALLDSPWQKHIASRHEYKGYPFPPMIWHTTLCRYKADLLPPQVRRLFESYKDKNLGSIVLGAPQLRRVNYDWSTTEIIE